MAQARAPRSLTAAAINKELVALDVASSRITDELITAGRGEERPSEYLRKSDPLSKRALANYERRMDLVAEIERRAGPGMRKLPKGFGPRKSGYGACEYSDKSIELRDADQRLVSCPRCGDVFGTTPTERKMGIAELPRHELT